MLFYDVIEVCVERVEQVDDLHGRALWRQSREAHDVREEDGTYESIAGIVHFINRLQHPYLKLESEEAIEAFLD